MSITFVSVYPLLKETPIYTEQHPDQWDLGYIYTLLKTGIRLCLYVSPDTCYDKLWKKWELEFPGLKIMPYRIDLKDTWIHKQCSKYPQLELPKHRNLDKDTYEYLVYGHAKIELLEDAISENPWSTTHFVWLDFHIVSVLHNKETLNWIANLGNRKFNSPLLALPGCWDKYNEHNVTLVAEHIYWRFCGGVLFGCIDKITELADLYRTHFPSFLKQYNTLTWDVNFWAWLEYQQLWTPTWYRSDHNDTLFYLSADLYTTRVPIKRRIKYNYPEIPSFYPGSASYVYLNGMHVLNTRFVNYWIYPNGCYLFHNPSHLIENINVMSLLDGNTMVPLNYVHMRREHIDCSGNPLLDTGDENAKRFKSEGLEDIRLFANGTQIRFIATNINFSPTGNNRMIRGDYNMETLRFENCMIVQPPDPKSWCEKNWIPLVDAEGEEWFIYKWKPMEIGKVNKETQVLEIHKCYDGLPGLFSKIRGSTTFIPWIDKDYLVGLVHFSEEHSPRHYYHMLVLLDMKTWRPVKYTNTFYFEHLAIEFCIGMAIKEGEYIFWISQFDRDALCVCVDIHQLPFLFRV